MTVYQGLTHLPNDDDAVDAATAYLAAARTAAQMLDRNPDSVLCLALYTLHQHPERVGEVPFMAAMLNLARVTHENMSGGPPDELPPPVSEALDHLCDVARYDLGVVL